MRRTSIDFYDPDGTDPTCIRRALEVATAMQTGNDATMVRHMFGEDRITITSLRDGDERRYVVYDAEAGLYIKKYGSYTDADLQRRTLNLLHARLPAELGLTATRVFAVQSGIAHPVSVIEPAKGASLKTIGLNYHYHRAPSPYRQYREKMTEAETVRQRVETVLGRASTRLLANDITMGNNTGGNVFRFDDPETNDPLYTLIDQPFVSNRNAYLIAAILRKFGA